MSTNQCWSNMVFWLLDPVQVEVDLAIVEVILEDTGYTMGHIHAWSPLKG